MDDVQRDIGRLEGRIDALVAANVERIRRDERLADEAAKFRAEVNAGLAAINKTLNRASGAMWLGLGLLSALAVVINIITMPLSRWLWK